MELALFDSPELVQAVTRLHFVLGVGWTSQYQQLPQKTWAQPYPWLQPAPLSLRLGYRLLGLEHQQHPTSAQHHSILLVPLFLHHFQDNYDHHCTRRHIP
jgi:hypothetical protein